VGGGGGDIKKDDSVFQYLRQREGVGSGGGTGEKGLETCVVVRGKGS
jgi:hypothetical protein